MLDDIPQDLRGYAQWCVWRYETREDTITKVPYDCKSGRLAAVDDPTTFSTFDQAVIALNTGAYNGVGFILTENDPFAFIDLDIKGHISPADLSRQISIQEKFDTYSERSPSGNGLHIICKGHVPRGRKRSNIEVYSSLRYMTITGDVYDKKPISERQGLLELLWSEMGVGTPIYDNKFDAPQVISDDEVIGRAMAAANGGKFTQLMQALWQELQYPSQSEADFALIDMIAFYTQNREQIVRIFKASWLGQRDKAKRVDYINMMVNRSFDRMLPQINYDSLRARFDEYVTGNKMNGAALTVSEAAPFDASSLGGNNPPLITAPESLVKFPPGLMGEIATFIFQASQRPVPEIALAAAIGLMAGICGRAYNTPTGAGLNLYTLLIALSGTGKEAMANGISRLIEAIATIQPGTEKVPSIREFLGPSEFRSDAGLIKSIERQPSMVSIIGEFGLKLKAMHAPHANAHVAGLKSVLLDVFSKSGFGNVYRPIVYSDQAKNTHNIQSPAFSVLAESTPSTFYDALDESMIAHGLLPRFFIIEYFGIRVPSNLSHANIAPTLELQHKLGQLAAGAHIVQHGGRTIYVQFEDQLTYTMADRFDKHCDNEVNATRNEVIRDLWNRGHLKALKLSSLVAVGIDRDKPLINAPIWEWTQQLVEADILRMVKRFEAGEVGADVSTNDLAQQKELLRMMREFLFRPWPEIAKYKCGAPAMQQAYVVPAAWINKRCIQLSPFKRDKRGPSPAINATLKQLLDNGIVADVTGKAKFDIGGRLYMIADTRYLKPED